jgi:hypothetical protein
MIFQSRAGFLWGWHIAALGKVEAWASLATAHRSYFGVQLVSFMAPDGNPFLSRFLVGSDTLWNWLGKVDGWSQKGPIRSLGLAHHCTSRVGWGQSDAWASPTIAHRSRLGIQLFSLKAANGIPILSMFLVVLTHWGIGVKSNPGPRPPSLIDPTLESSFFSISRPVGFQA